MNLAIIPARGGSKRIPKKNIRPFMGKPIIAYSIEAAFATGVFDRVVVSTDDQEIADVAMSYGAEIPFIRPGSLSDDFIGTDDVVRHCLKWFSANGEDVSFCCCIYATAPLIRPDDIIEGYEEMVHNGATSAFSVTPFDYPIYRGLKITDDGRVEMIWPEHRTSRSQDLPKAYHDAGQFYWIDVDKMPENGPLFFGPNARPVILPPWRVQDIDTLDDWKRAELLFSAENKNTLKKTGGK